LEQNIVNNFQLRYQWTGAGNDAPELKQTMCRFELQVGSELLTQNEDIFSQTISDSVLVSAYPLAHWFAASWWRLTSEPLPPREVRPSSSWRMAHEVGAANSGYVWPQILFATDGEVMQVWAATSRENRAQSVRYLNGLTAPMAVSISEFESRVEGFINAVIARLDATGLHTSSLKSLWAEVMEERVDLKTTLARRCEAELGYDPDECPDDALAMAISLKDRMGEAALSELAPVYGKSEGEDAIGDLGSLIECKGILGKPELPKNRPRVGRNLAPWERAVEDARTLRKELGAHDDKVDTGVLCSVLGIRKEDAEHYNQNSRARAAVGVPRGKSQISIIPRRRHPVARRFELARFVGDLLYVRGNTDAWLASTDLSTSRQKYQRAFAAEFLCPIDNLKGFLNDDLSEDNIEDAAKHFGISEATVNSLLANNNLIYRDYSSNGLPYSLS
jgi:Zn-dependent peptidase ImmA (M78 family)